MGRANIACVAGCKCAPHHFDSEWEGRPRRAVCGCAWAEATGVRRAPTSRNSGTSPKSHGLQCALSGAQDCAQMVATLMVALLLPFCAGATEQKFSLLYLHEFKVSQNPKCEIQVTVAQVRTGCTEGG